jgi:hypothetical protein
VTFDDLARALQTAWKNEGLPTARSWTSEFTGTKAKELAVALRMDFVA